VFAQRGDQFGVVTVALHQGGATGEHDTRMEHVGPRELHEVQDSQHARD